MVEKEKDWFQKESFMSFILGFYLNFTIVLKEAVCIGSLSWSVFSEPGISQEFTTYLN